MGDTNSGTIIAEGQHKALSDLAYCVFNELGFNDEFCLKMSISLSLCFSKAISGQKLLEMAHWPIPWNVRLHKNYWKDVQDVYLKLTVQIFASKCNAV